MYVNYDIFVLIKIKYNDNNVNIDNPLVFKTWLYTINKYVNKLSNC